MSGSIRIEMDLHRPDKDQIDRIARLFLDGKVLLYPTDTVYGLGCDPLQKGALQRLSEIKGRTPEKSYIWLIGSSSWAQRLTAELPQEFHRLAGQFWPGPLTLILKASPHLPLESTGPGRTIALRWARCLFLEELFARLKIPVVSTSANLAGERVLEDPEFSDSPILQQVDGIVAAGPLIRPASTIVDLTCHPAKLIREGCLKREHLFPSSESCVS